MVQRGECIKRSVSTNSRIRLYCSFFHYFHIPTQQTFPAPSRRRHDKLGTVSRHTLRLRHVTPADPIRIMVVYLPSWFPSSLSELSLPDSLATLTSRVAATLANMIPKLVSVEGHLVFVSLSAHNKASVYSLTSCIASRARNGGEKSRRYSRNCSEDEGWRASQRGRDRSSSGTSAKSK